MRYDFPQKQSGFRVPFWNAVDGFIKKPRALRTVAYLDTAAALETIYLLGLGYAAQNLLAVNRSSAQVAALTQKLARLSHPKVQTAGADFADAVWGSGPIDILAFDGTSNVDGDVGDVMLLNASFSATPKVLGFNLLAGRERKRMPLIRQFAENISQHRSCRNRPERAEHIARVLTVICNSCGHVRVVDVGLDEIVSECVQHPIDLKWACYRSASGQSFVWAVVKVEPHIRGRSCSAAVVSSFHRTFQYVPVCWREYYKPEYDIGCPTWTESQATACGYDLSEVRSRFDGVGAVRRRFSA